MIGICDIILLGLYAAGQPSVKSSFDCVTFSEVYYEILVTTIRKALLSE